MVWLRRFLVWAFRIWGGKFAMTHFKRKGLIVYLRTLQIVRKSVLAAIAFFCLLQLMIFGAIGTFVTAVLLSNQDQVAKLWILLAGSLLMFAVPMIGLAFLFSERTWLKASGAQEYFEKESPAPSPSPVEVPH
jgi:hypothetical protein